MQELLNRYASNDIPFLFILDFDLLKPVVIELKQVDTSKVLYDINGFRNYSPPQRLNKKINFVKHPISIDEYKTAFYKVQEELKKGNSYLVNLTFPTEIDTNLSLKEIFYFSKAKYKLFYNDRFVVFSPEQFVGINNGTIATFPMKGTIDASVPNAAAVIMADEKEHAEHITIVDLLRNDLGIVSRKVRVNRFRYIDKIETLDQELLQVSSEICGQLDANWSNRMGDILYALLPAGSITGAPKKKTVEIIKAVENYNRGYYTGIFGCFNGKILDSAVMIRFIEKREDGTLVYKSGGGITIYSDMQYEYNELVDKVYVPIAGNNKNKE